eukprot:CAMPEP_0197589622 /NCGR_PEP_ID=MMETSP1326-20131121/10502_1 /TAXON_ID=1155430 /ORGANISM="Genus nov. species nov., Strain RCC2288" /LENGTH=65 /DNA_ID=CAMNT_0043154575 /DNA_START=22 /DNA_END=215 /DNA_ORIENTATION=+
MGAFSASAVIRAASAAAAAAVPARVPSIKFPVRRLPDGTRVSDLPLHLAEAAAKSTIVAANSGAA